MRPPRIPQLCPAVLSCAQLPSCLLSVMTCPGPPPHTTAYSGNFRLASRCGWGVAQDSSLLSAIPSSCRDEKSGRGDMKSPASSPILPHSRNVTQYRQYTYLPTKFYAGFREIEEGFCSKGQSHQIFCTWFFCTNQLLLVLLEMS